MKLKASEFPLLYQVWGAERPFLFLGMDVGGRGAVIQLSDGPFQLLCLFASSQPAQPCQPLVGKNASPPLTLPPALRHHKV